MTYERISRLGRGGMGVVDLARRPDGSQVAVKRLTLHGSTDDMHRAQQRIEREAQALSRLDHPNIVPLLEVIEEGDEIVLVMPYLAGGTLADRVSRHGPAPADEVDRLADQLASALAAAHRAGVVHRDIKPGNVLFDSDGVPHLADFGVASTRDDTAGLTAVGTVVGTPGYMAPEQARGEQAGQAADVFSLGATLRFAATGEGPYGKGAPDLLMVRAAQGRVEPVPRTVPIGLRRRIEAMLDPRAEHRPSPAALVGGPGGTTVRPRVLARRGRRRALAGFGMALLAVGALVAGAAVASRETKPAPTTTTPSTTEPCTPRAYQPCGQSAPAPNTDGDRCLEGFDDYDALARNGCEAQADEHADADPLTEPIDATIVPRDDIDTFSVDVRDNRQLLCDGRLTITLTAPPGMSLRLEVLEGDEQLGTATSADGVAGSVTIREPDCFSNDATTLTARVSPIGSDRSGEPYRLERSGSF